MAHARHAVRASPAIDVPFPLGSMEMDHDLPRFDAAVRRAIAKKPRQQRDDASYESAPYRGYLENPVRSSLPSWLPQPLKQDEAWLWKPDPEFAGTSDVKEDLRSLLAPVDEQSQSWVPKGTYTTFRDALKRGEWNCNDNKYHAVKNRRGEATKRGVMMFSNHHDEKRSSYPDGYELQIIFKSLTSRMALFRDAGPIAMKLYPMTGHNESEACYVCTMVWDLHTTCTETLLARAFDTYILHNDTLPSPLSDPAGDSNDTVDDSNEVPAEDVSLAVEEELEEGSG